MMALDRLRVRTNVILFPLHYRGLAVQRCYKKSKTVSIDRIRAHRRCHYKHISRNSSKECNQKASRESANFHQADILSFVQFHGKVTSRPVSESESERQRARNWASESERDFSRERATKHTSESKRAKFRIGRDFRYSPLQWSSDVCGIYRTWEPCILSPVSIVSIPTLNKHGLFLGYPLFL